MVTVASSVAATSWGYKATVSPENHPASVNAFAFGGLAGDVFVTRYR